jgi:hypothetical protein
MGLIVFKVVLQICCTEAEVLRRYCTEVEMSHFALEQGISVRMPIVYTVTNLASLGFVLHSAVQ